LSTDHLLMNVRETAALMRVGRDVVYRMIRENELPHVHLGRHIRVPTKTLIAYLHELAGESGGQKP